MDAKKKKSIVIWVSVTALLGVGGYFAYTKLIKPKLDELKAKKAAEEAAKASASLGSTPAPTSGSIPSSGGSSSAPLYPDDILKFQLYVLNVIGDKNILGNAGADGKWGSKTAAAYEKYADRWRASLGITPPKPPTTAPNGFAAIGKNAYIDPRFAYANIWSEPKIVTGFGSTFVGQVNQPNIIGKITNATMSDGFMWYKVNLVAAPSKSTGGYGQGNPYLRTGWVAALSTIIK